VATTDAVDHRAHALTCPTCVASLRAPPPPAPPSVRRCCVRVCLCVFVCAVCVCHSPQVQQMRAAAEAEIQALKLRVMDEARRHIAQVGCWEASSHDAYLRHACIMLACLAGDV
jgi:hypothetical protein